jgi:hypothetical protein
MTWLAAGLATLVLLWLLARAFVSADPAKLASGLRWVAVGLGAVLLVFLALRGIFIFALPLAGIVAGFGGKPLWDRFRGVHQADNPRSEVKTPWLSMSLDHATGEMNGVVRQGRFEGRRLSELGRVELQQLWRQCRAEDEASAALVETYLDRAFPDWRDTDAAEEPREEAPRSGRGGATMDEKEAWAVLGLEPGAGPDEIKGAHHRLMLKLHPDHGGSTWLAARLNEARDLLLKKARARP